GLGVAVFGIETALDDLHIFDDVAGDIHRLIHGAEPAERVFDRHAVDDVHDFVIAAAADVDFAEAFNHADLRLEHVLDGRDRHVLDGFGGDLPKVGRFGQFEEVALGGNDL